MDNASLWPARAARLLLLGILLFVVNISLAMYFYPGGSVVCGATTRYLFWGNFLSALGFTETVSGHDNMLSHRFFATGLNCIALLMLPTVWVRSKQLFPSRALRWFSQTLGLFSSVGFILVGQLPFDRFPAGHTVSVVVGFLPWLFFSGALLWSEGYRFTWPQRLGLGILPALIAIHGCQGLARLLSGTFTMAQPVVQKLIVLWMLLLLFWDACRALRHKESCLLKRDGRVS